MRFELPRLIEDRWTGVEARRNPPPRPLEEDSSPLNSAAPQAVAPILEHASDEHTSDIVRPTKIHALGPDILARIIEAAPGREGLAFYHEVVLPKKASERKQVHDAFRESKDRRYFRFRDELRDAQRPREGKRYPIWTRATKELVTYQYLAHRVAGLRTADRLKRAFQDLALVPGQQDLALRESWNVLRGEAAIGRFGSLVGELPPSERPRTYNDLLNAAMYHPWCLEETVVDLAQALEALPRTHVFDAAVATLDARPTPKVQQAVVSSYFKRSMHYQHELTNLPRHLDDPEALALFATSLRPYGIAREHLRSVLARSSDARVLQALLRVIDAKCEIDQAEESLAVARRAVDEQTMNQAIHAVWMYSSHAVRAQRLAALCDLSLPAGSLRRVIALVDDVDQSERATGWDAFLSGPHPAQRVSVLIEALAEIAEQDRYSVVEAILRHDASPPTKMALIPSFHCLTPRDAARAFDLVTASSCNNDIRGLLAERLSLLDRSDRLRQAEKLVSETSDSGVLAAVAHDLASAEFNEEDSYRLWTAIAIKPTDDRIRLQLVHAIPSTPLSKQPQLMSMLMRATSDHNVTCALLALDMTTHPRMFSDAVREIREQAALRKDIRFAELFAEQLPLLHISESDRYREFRALVLSAPMPGVRAALEKMLPWKNRDGSPGDPQLSKDARAFLAKNSSF